MSKHCKQICSLDHLKLFALFIALYLVVERLKNNAPNSLEGCREFLTLDPEIQDEDLVFSGKCKMHNYTIK